jgi:serine/threonine protein kinase
MHEGRLVASKYRIARLIAAGSMGEVYEAVHVGIGKHVALKVMPHELTSSRELTARFRREVRAAGMLESEYIVQVFDAGQDAELGLYLVTEFLVGEDLEVRLARERHLDAATAAAIGYQVARGLAKAHAAGVIHRDLKPGNIFLAERDGGARIAKILDFGVSKRRTVDDVMVDADEEEFTTAVGVTLGTPEYMSPEQAEGLPDLDNRADVWSLAATLYHALSGQPPYEGDSPVSVMMRIVSEDARPLAVVAPWVPAALCGVVNAGLSRDRDERTPDAASFAEALAAAVPEARWSPSGRQRILPGYAPPAAATIPSPPPDAEPFESGPPSSAGSRVQFFRRDGVGELRGRGLARGG